MAVGAALVAAAPAAARTVAVSGGLIEGTTSDDGSALLYQGIPYAAPPVANLRWRPPAPTTPWTGVRDAKREAPACLQNDYTWNRSQYLFGSEDCLTLDVRAPVTADKLLPVMVWIHGGSNRAGGSGGTVHSSITAKGVVLVSVQYRLGIFGFLSHRQLAAERGGSSGNYGLMDQIAALIWVQENISRFGGNPDNVTIFGESAGSQDVALLLASPSARRLFHKAIMQSGTPGFGMPPRPLSEALAIGDQLASLAGGGGIERLRAMSAHALLAADLNLKDPAIWTQEFLWLRPTLDGEILPRPPGSLFAEGTPRPVIIGSNRYEFGPAKGSIDTEAYARHWFGALSDDAMRLYKSEETDGDPRLGHLEGRMETDVVFRCPANNLATQLSKLGWPVWKYEFDIGPDDGTPGGGLTSHAFEIRYILDRKPFGPSTSPVYLQDYWTAFAKAGSDRLPQLANWPAYSPRSKSYVLFDAEGITSKNDLRREHCMMVGAI